jgi:hypothetical protein
VTSPYVSPISGVWWEQTDAKQLTLGLV